MLILSIDRCGSIQCHHQSPTVIAGHSLAWFDTDRVQAIIIAPGLRD